MRPAPAPATEAFRLSPTLQAPAIARRHITDLLLRAGRQDAVETAVLLVSEIVTNVVLHAGTEIRIEISFDDEELTFAVSDSNPGPIAGGEPAARLQESGRGLALINSLARRWGTTHSQLGKTVWFTLGTEATSQAARPALASGDERPRAVPLVLGNQLGDKLVGDEAIEELLARLLDVTAADAGVVLLDPTNGTGTPQVAARRGDPQLLVTAPSRCSAPLAALGPPIGKVHLAAVRTDAFGADAASWVSLLAFEMALLAQLHRQHEENIARQGWSSFLAEASDLLAGSLDVSRTLALLCQLVVSRLDSSAVAYLYDNSDVLELSYLAHADEQRLPELRELVAGSDLPAQLAGRRHQTTAPVAAGEQRGIALALRARGRLLGWLTVLRPTARPFAPAERATLTDLAHRAALAVDNARLFAEQAAVAAALQSALLPPHLPPPGALDFGASYHAARQDLSVGGDFYDLLALSDDEWMLAIGDVCGKGAEAAAVTGVARDVLRLLLRQGLPAPAALRQLNEALLFAEHGRFCTVAITRLHRAAGSWTATIWSAGHPLPALLAPDGSVTLVGASGTLLGVLPGEELDLPSAEVALPPGHALILYTDGITERRRGGEQFGDTGLLAALRDCRGLSAQAVAGHLDRVAAAFAEEPMRDDNAVLVARVPLVSNAEQVVVPQRSGAPV